ncbi:hypothetical protein BO94DRAFT_589835 [Aspergillus sclerotioniger CBS 115572]|uniref:Uncharacterized protein n=1 Tax=Aspergillus sclerotioniger CBS 115572 TaxID=1450535 RepID=A0A317VC16_9EURO|nr:hypothetical protein BO94DRAFT_589835 [Aspergillus sclerotioniger CBS 115572]PWY71766.1 hypothetical protein BO94DRAFT_589835 [Aspergillus sclerotioniger CBS 115572]
MSWEVTFFKVRSVTGGAAALYANGQMQVPVIVSFKALDTTRDMFHMFIYAYASVLLTWREQDGTEYATELVAGVVGIQASLSLQTREAAAAAADARPDMIQPAPGWWVYEKK